MFQSIKKILMVAPFFSVTATWSMEDQPGKEFDAQSSDGKFQVSAKKDTEDKLRATIATPTGRTFKSLNQDDRIPSSPTTKDLLEKTLKNVQETHIQGAEAFQKEHQDYAGKNILVTPNTADFFIRASEDRARLVNAFQGFFFYEELYGAFVATGNQPVGPFPNEEHAVINQFMVKNGLLNQKTQGDDYSKDNLEATEYGLVSIWPYIHGGYDQSFFNDFIGGVDFYVQEAIKAEHKTPPTLIITGKTPKGIMAFLGIYDTKTQEAFKNAGYTVALPKSDEKAPADEKVAYAFYPNTPRAMAYKIF